MRLDRSVEWVPEIIVIAALMNESRQSKNPVPLRLVERRAASGRHRRRVQPLPRQHDRSTSGCPVQALERPEYTRSLVPLDDRILLHPHERSRSYRFDRRIPRRAQPGSETLHLDRQRQGHPRKGRTCSGSSRSQGPRLPGQLMRTSSFSQSIPADYTGRVSREAPAVNASSPRARPGVRRPRIGRDPGRSERPVGPKDGRSRIRACAHSDDRGHRNDETAEVSAFVRIRTRVASGSATE
jgi:hypothetical protein